MTESERERARQYHDRTVPGAFIYTSREDRIAFAEFAVQENAALRQELAALKAKIAVGPTNTLDDISFREALRSEVIVVTLNENETLKSELAEAQRRIEQLQDSLQIMTIMESLSEEVKNAAFVAEARRVLGAKGEVKP